MLFSSPVFVFLFLPAVLVLTALSPRVVRNATLAVASLFFYAWGEREIVVLMLASIAVNWALGLWAGRAREAGRSARAAITLAVVFNLGLLVFFKYANFLWRDLGAVCVGLGLTSSWPVLTEIHLPIGISFFTFQALSYVLDVYRGQGPVQRNPVDFATYIALFPQLIAGPIVRYKDVALQLRDRVVDRAGFAYGVRRFGIGLGKKMLIANVVAQVADDVFALPVAEITPGTAWLGITCYTLQIYFDFSGYSDMAIGLGRMFGFRFLENFDYPYISRSITEFWRRWHISLSTWFRDYLYIPLGGNRRGPARTYLNLVLVFFLCGLWHGASWSFVVWGLYHGAFLVIERVGLARAIGRLGALRHVYVLVVAMVGWVFFRADTLGQASAFLGRMFGLASYAEGIALEVPRTFLDARSIVALIAGAIGSTPWLPRVAAWLASRRERSEPGVAVDVALELAGHAALAGVFVASATMLAADTYNPFIYFRF